MESFFFFLISLHLHFLFSHRLLTHKIAILHGSIQHIFPLCSLSNTQQGKEVLHFSYQCESALYGSHLGDFKNCYLLLNSGSILSKHTKDLNSY